MLVPSFENASSAVARREKLLEAARVIERELSKCGKQNWSDVCDSIREIVRDDIRFSPPKKRKKIYVDDLVLKLLLGMNGVDPTTKMHEITIEYEP